MSKYHGSAGDVRVIFLYRCEAIPSAELAYLSGIIFTVQPFDADTSFLTERHSSPSQWDAIQSHIVILQKDDGTRQGYREQIHKATAIN